MKQTMKQFELHPMRLLPGACGLFTLLALTPMSVAQQAASAATKTVASPTTQSAVAAKPAAKPVAEDETTQPNSANQQGIKIHGHWVLQVKNADGTLGERREFDNSLVGGANGESVSGAQVLALLLSGNASPGDPGIAFIPSGVSMADPTLPCSNFGSTSECFGFTTTKSPLLSTFSLPNTTCNSVVPGCAGNPLYSSQTGLKITTNYSPLVDWVLAGNYTVPSGLSSIGYVETILPACIFGLPPSNILAATTVGGFPRDPQLLGSSNDRSSVTASSGCDNNFAGVVFGTLTSTAVTSGGVPTPLPVVQGQIVQVTVTISFS